MGVRDISVCLEQEGIKVSHMTIYNWISEYSKMASVYLNGIVPRVDNWFRADEVWVRVNGVRRFLFVSMDDDTRFWLAMDMADTKKQHNTDYLLELTKKQIGKISRNFITDGLTAYRKSSRKVFSKKTNQIKHIHITDKRDKDNNNTMESLNGEFRDREKVFRRLKRMDTPIIDGMRVYYNFTKKHDALNGKIPVDATLILINGLNKWKTIIQNASLYKISQ